MSRVSRLPAALRRRFRTGRPCLDLVHTGGEGLLAHFEVVHDPADAGRYLGLVAGLDDDVPATAEDLRAFLEEWERIWFLDHPSMMTPYRTHGGII